jgi:hypothetical protein
MNKRFKLTSKNGKILMYVSSLLFLSFIILFLHGCGDRKTEFPDSLVPEPTSVIESIPSEESDGKIKDNISDSAEEEDLNPFSLVLTFAGDINFDENWSTMKYYNSVENGIYDCISP